MPTIRSRQSGKLGVSKLKGNFELIDVSFTYPNGTEALHHINMKIPHGKTVAFVGLSGAGKSTLLNLLTQILRSDKRQGTFGRQGIDRV